MALLISAGLLLYTILNQEHKQGNIPEKCCGNVAAYHIEVLYKIREDDIIKKTKEKKMDGSFLCVSKLSSQFLLIEVKCSKRQSGSLKSLPLHQAIAFASGRNDSQNFMSRC